MRAICLLLTVACVPVFAQKAIPLIPPPSAQRLEQLRAKLFTESAKPRYFAANVLAGGTCSIPLLNVVPPGTPVKMPKFTPPKDQRDRISTNRVPAPACPSSLGHVGAPAPALEPPATPPPGTPAPRKP